MVEALVWLVCDRRGSCWRSVDRRERPRVGSASAGTIYDWLNEDKRKAVEIVVEGRAERRDLEHPDDTIPDDEIAGGPPPR